MSPIGIHMWGCVAAVYNGFPQCKRDLGVVGKYDLQARPWP
jgi:hypothetical protein